MNSKNLNLCYNDLTIRVNELKGQNWKVTFFTIISFALLLGLDAASFISGVPIEKVNYFRFFIVLALILIMEFGVSNLLISAAELLRIKRRIQICRNLFNEEVNEFLDDHKQYEKWYNQYNILFQVTSIILLATLILLHLFGSFG